MEIESADGESQNPSRAVEAELDALRLDHKPSKKAKAKAAAREEEEEEGGYLLDLPTFSDLGNGRLRCVETGHELPSREKDAYSRTKACRLALIDAAIAAKKPPLNVFRPHPTSKSQVVCQLTGDTVNKTEKHIWKHLNGKSFLKKLEQKEMEKLSPVKAVEKDTKKSKKKQEKTVHKHDKEKHVDQNECLTKETDADGTDLEEQEFWVPPVGDRWDFDDGNDCWDSCENLDDKEDNNGSLAGENKMDDSEHEQQHEEQQERSKRTSKAVGPSSFASRKKKPKKNNKGPQ